MAGIVVSKKHKAIVMPFDKAVANIVPVKTIDTPEGKQMVIPHTHDVVRLLRNMGHRVRAPITCHYDWNGSKPFRTQQITAAMLTMNKRAYVLSEMGTGKTRSTLFAVDYLRREQQINRTLVVAPLSTLSTVWDKEVFRYFNHMSVGVLHGTKAQRLQVLAQDHDIYVINHDGLKTILTELQSRTDIDCVIVDELAAFRNARTDRWKALNSVITGRKYVWGLTGSPTPNDPSDAWAQTKLLTPEKVPKFFKRFKESVMMQVSTFRWIPRKEANDVVFEAMQPSVRFTRDECVELPPTIFRDYEVALSPEQEKTYKRLVDKLRVAFAEGEVTAANEGVLLGKLMQINTGYVYTKDRKVVSLDNSPRIDALIEVINEALGKVIVFVDFIHASHEVAAKLRAAGFDVAQVSGETSKKDRDTIFNTFESAVSPRVLVAHPKCMAHGLTLTAADTIVWFTPTTSLDTYEQACARITRPGQKRKQLILHLTGTPIERKLYRRLQQKASLQGALLEMFEGGI